ncbi:hypothetical protein BJ508DRAFT_358916 [Ascobolus immersus RN42]|uniref:Uncharacterized protein n=1 Tax=Ascobolus immersus RN42 TaxID=1160509 RepID=A0A3N4IN05_ASCIM|nr:hypothetical protein BJ508DRAFT_358916 [Ascobolus immersus RN42]
MSYNIIDLADSLYGKYIQQGSSELSHFRLHCEGQDRIVRCDLCGIVRRLGHKAVQASPNLYLEQLQAWVEENGFDRDDDVLAPLAALMPSTPDDQVAPRFDRIRIEGMTGLYIAGMYEQMSDEVEPQALLDGDAAIIYCCSQNCLERLRNPYSARLTGILGSMSDSRIMERRLEMWGCTNVLNDDQQFFYTRRYGPELFGDKQVIAVELAPEGLKVDVDEDSDMSELDLNDNDNDNESDMDMEVDSNDDGDDMGDSQMDESSDDESSDDESDSDGDLDMK